MKKVNFAQLSQTAKKYILHTARDLPLGRLLACVTPSACRAAMEPDVKLGRTYSHDLMIFCEQVSRLCRDDPWAKAYLLEGQSPSDRPHIVLARSYPQMITCYPWQIECDVVERMSKYVRDSLSYEEGVFCEVWYGAFKLERTDRSRQFSIEFGARRDEQKGVMRLNLSDPVHCFDDILEVVTIVGTLQDMAGGKVVRSKSRILDHFCIDAEFPLVVPKYSEEKESYRSCLEQEVAVYRGCRLWREAVAVEIEKVFRAHGLGFVFDK